MPTRTQQEIIEHMLGAKDVQLALLITRVEALEAELAACKATKPSEDPTP